MYEHIYKKKKLENKAKQDDQRRHVEKREEYEPMQKIIEEQETRIKLE